MKKPVKQSRADASRVQKSPSDFVDEVTQMRTFRSSVFREDCSAGTMQRSLLLSLAALLFGISGPVHAAPMPQTSTYATILTPISSPFCNPGCFDPTFSRMAATDSYGNSYLALASASFGSVGAEVTASEAGSGGSPRFLAEADGYMVDNIAISGPTGTGTISFNVDLHGSAFTTVPGIVDPNLNFVFGANAPLGSGRIQVVSSVDGYPSTTFTTAPFAYTFGDPITIFMELTVNLNSIGGVDSGPLIANLLYFNTASISGLTVLDESGSPVTNFSISAESGTQYLQPVPLPGSAGLFVTAGLMVLRRRRRRSVVTCQEYSALVGVD